ncbi:GFA family protein [Roseibium aestuarii]|uniref:GFA family protein n=1 Tax=Roseibium aestuarii TaxID=2600299 RepID=A0ABW4JZL7_9HYPH|nr:GFA family protein [Roseibium aestuarii]
MLKGRCDCGKVSFEVPSVEPNVTLCHCSQCRRMSGHIWASTRAPWDAVTFTCDGGLAWYESSSWAQRGFCRHCGSSLFYRRHEVDHVAIAAGCLEAPTGMSATRHIFLKDKGDYYDVTDNLEKFERY